MNPGTVGPLSRPYDVSRLPARGTPIHVHATAEECEVLAKDFGISAIRALSADYTIDKTAKGVRVRGAVRATIVQICVVTLDPFESEVTEQVEVDFAEPSGGMPAAPPNDEHDYEPPDEIVDGRIDLGALTAEFLAIGLDPYPRKPGVDFEPRIEEVESPFAALSKLKGE
jgi:uncharacterized metal-binding protein YceD (DUF177 family)